ncbi:putative Dol-P-Glc:Glc(2)Man(9)GlcNAc(2)-PP-Dol alpha-1,2-glucosyltransferase [Melitaea cinxia]|uniref:putative Dol-P-Glc:Glc(2)Man(9)GlcNAc(2)-PP-Dol alpha-1,2-glucosyltransferase n=1 Tax=Melitaea cinxia TaxID=113334 RepID=UPI001E273CA8|nr:putative Dol-P-Glc:Glc(2)Man(9)GlcNAc(2)-PP-Dol alpha-1,2-glucosyltransferase [Melitaea cinxia]
MRRNTKYYLLLFFTVSLYFTVSKLIFDKVYETSQVVIDEFFHIPQGMLYCKYNFSYWDSKITTLPGLYMVSTVAIGPFFECNTYNLRFVNLVGSCINLMLFASMLKFIYANQNGSQAKNVLQALNMALLPPLYFFSHIYYTDTMSLMFVLLFTRLCIITRSKWLIFIIGLCCVVMRQTNVVWVAMVFGHKMLNIIIRSSRVFGNRHISKSALSMRSITAQDIDPSKLKRYYNLYDAAIALKYHMSTGFSIAFRYTNISDWLIMVQQIAVLLTFIMFLLLNGSIVVGDKKAHMVTIHVTQLLYFLLFYGVFGLPYVIAKASSTLKLMLNNKMYVLFFSILFYIIVHFNTLIHPYMLADNRHYTFYLWNRWFRKYDFAIYATVPAYVFFLFSLYDNLKDHNCISFLLPYSICIFIVVALQKLVEIRYFLIPYIVLRLRFVRPSFKMVIAEFLYYVIINAVTFNIFFTKKIIWNTLDEVQRIIW